MSDSRMTDDEAAACINKMREASSAFYRAATATNNHTFIEFTGLMNEYINLCSEAWQQGIDFTMANKHTGQHLPFQRHHLAYISEKLECIYGRPLADIPSYIPAKHAIEMLGFFDAAGFGKPGSPNTLWAMIQQALKQIDDLKQEVKQLQGDRP